jgi:hypothetical protein
LRRFFGQLAIGFLGLLASGAAGGNERQAVGVKARAEGTRFRIPSSQIVHVTHHTDPRQFQFLDGRHDVPATASDRLRYYAALARDQLPRCETRGDLDALQLMRSASVADRGRVMPLPLRHTDATVYPLCGYHTAPLTRLSIGIDAAPFSRKRLPRDHRFYYYEARTEPWVEAGNVWLGEGYPVDFFTKDVLSDLRRQVGSGFSIEAITIVETMDRLMSRDEKRVQIARHGIVRYDPGDGGPMGEHVHLNIKLSEGDPARVQPWIEAYWQEIARHQPRLWLFRATQNRFLEPDGYNARAHPAHAAWIEAVVRDSFAGGFVAEGRENYGDYRDWGDPRLWDKATWEFFGRRPLPAGASTAEFRGVEWGYATAAGNGVPQLRVVSVPGRRGSAR